MGLVEEAKILKEQVTEYNNKRIAEKTKLDMHMARLKSEFGCDSLDQAIVRLNEMKAELDVAEKELAQNIEVIKVALNGTI